MNFSFILSEAIASSCVDVIKRSMLTWCWPMANVTKDDSGHVCWKSKALTTEQKWTCRKTYCRKTFISLTSQLLHKHLLYFGIGSAFQRNDRISGRETRMHEVMKWRINYSSICAYFQNYCWHLGPLVVWYWLVTHIIKQRICHINRSSQNMGSIFFLYYTTFTWVAKQVLFAVLLIHN